jgi:hypothetical protein
MTALTMLRSGLGLIGPATDGMCSPPSRWTRWRCPSGTTAS